MDNEIKKALDDIGAIPLPDDEIVQKSTFVLSMRCEDCTHPAPGSIKLSCIKCNEPVYADRLSAKMAGRIVCTRCFQEGAFNEH